MCGRGGGGGRCMCQGKCSKSSKLKHKRKIAQSMANENLEKMQKKTSK